MRHIGRPLGRLGPKKGWAQGPMEKMLASKQHEDSMRVPRVVAVRGNFIVLLGP